MDLKGMLSNQSVLEKQKKQDQSMHQTSHQRLQELRDEHTRFTPHPYSTEHSSSLSHHPSASDSHVDKQYLVDEEYGFWEASGPPPASDRFGNQPLTEIFPKVNLNDIADETERNAYQDILHDYAEVLHNKAKQAYPEIFQHYDKSEIYYKWYGGIKELKQLVAVYDTRNDTISIGPSKSLLHSRLGIDADCYPNLYQQKNMQTVLEYIKSGKIVHWATYGILKPLNKKKSEYATKKSSEVKQSPIGLYVTDNVTLLTQEFGGTQNAIVILYNATNSQKTVGPWTLPLGAVKERPQLRGGPKPKLGDVFKFETPKEPS